MARCTKISSSIVVFRSNAIPLFKCTQVLTFFSTITRRPFKNDITHILYQFPSPHTVAKCIQRPPLILQTLIFMRQEQSANCGLQWKTTVSLDKENVGEITENIVCYRECQIQRLWAILSLNRSHMLSEFMTPFSHLLFDVIFEWFNVAAFRVSSYTTTHSTCVTSKVCQTQSLPHQWLRRHFHHVYMLNSQVFRETTNAFEESKNLCKPCLQTLDESFQWC